MRLEISADNLTVLVQRQIDNLFILHGREGDVIADAVPQAISRADHCFARSSNKYYSLDGETYFSPYHSGQYSIFLYFFANSIFDSLGSAQKILADKVYYLNKCLNGLDLYYEVRMPKVFFLDHPVGTVLGRAQYGEYFSFSQNCTVGNNNGRYPSIGNHVSMLSGSKILGHCHIGDRVVLSANSYVKDVDIPSCSIVFGSSPNLVVKRDIGKD